jgi:hypothetical protein
MSPQTGPDLVGAGYPTGNAITALLGGTGNGVSPNVPVYTNAYFAAFGGGGNLQDVSGQASGASGSVWSVAVPITPGAVISKISWVVGATGTACSSAVTNLWSALYTGTGSAPGTTNAQPVLIGATASLSGASVTASQLLTFTLSSVQTITATQAPNGFIYAAFSENVGGASPNVTEFSRISFACASAAMYPWYSTSPYSLYMSSNGGTGASVPANIGTATRQANPPIVLLY